MYNPKESSSIMKLTSPDVGQSDACICIDDGLVGPKMEASHVSVLARITTACMHVAQRGVV